MCKLAFTNFAMFFLVMGFISVVDKIRFMLISNRSLFKQQNKGLPFSHI